MSIFPRPVGAWSCGKAKTAIARGKTRSPIGRRGSQHRILPSLVLVLLSSLLFYLYYFANTTVQPIPDEGPGKTKTPLLLANAQLPGLHPYNLQPFVNPAVKRVLRAALLGLCQKFTLRCFLNLGTLLGAHRGGKVLDWDRDADLGILAEDFRRLEEIVRRAWTAEGASASSASPSGGTAVAERPAEGQEVPEFRTRNPFEGMTTAQLRASAVEHAVEYFDVKAPAIRIGDADAAAVGAENQNGAGVSSQQGEGSDEQEEEARGGRGGGHDRRRRCGCLKLDR